MLPRIEAVDLRHGNVETLLQTVFQAFYNVTLLFERMRRLYDNIEREHTNDWHSFDFT
jgi:hypothetical protein